IEDAAGRTRAVSDPHGLVAELSSEQGPAPEPGARGWMAVPPRRIAGHYVGVFCGAVDDDAGKRLGTVRLAADLGAVMTFVGDPHGLDDSGEVLVGWKRGDRIYLPLPPRGDPALAEVTADEFPSLNAAISGEFDFGQTTDYRNRDVL